MASQIIDFIHQQHNCISYARDFLGWNVRKNGDRTTSFAPDSHNPNALVIYHDWFYDFKQNIGGDVIDLCAHVRHNGNRGAAIRELAGDFFKTQSYDTRWVTKSQDISEKIELWHKKLRDEDRNYLHSRRISDETIDRLKIGFNSYTARIIIPYFKNNKPVYYIGRDTTEAWKKPKGEGYLPKYAKAPVTTVDDTKNSDTDGIICNLPWGLHSLYSQRVQHSLLDEKDTCFNFDDWLVIAEGAIDALTFEQQGFHVLSSMGTPFSGIQLKQVITIAKTFKHVLLTYDNDSEGNKFQIKMAKEFFSHKIDFYSAVIPRTVNGHDNIKDISDYFCADGNLFDLFNTAVKGIDFLCENIYDSKDFKEFALKAARYVDKADLIELFQSIPDDKFNRQWLRAIKDMCLRAPAEVAIVEEFIRNNNIKYIENEGFYQYEAGLWHAIYDNNVKRTVADLLGRYATNGRINNITNFLKAKLSTDEEFNTQHIFNFINGVLNLDTGEFLPHSPAFMSTIQLNYAYDKNAKCDKWRKFISDAMEANPDKIALLQEIAGYIQFSDNKLQKCFFLKGDGSNGKSVFIDVLREVYNRKNCSNVDVSNFGGPFDPIRMRRSLVNFCAEAKINLKDAESRFKAIVTGDVISAAFKGKDAIEFAPRCKIISACNNFIGSNDTSYGFIRRILFVNFNKVFKGKDINKNLTQELLEELPGIFNWAYEGYLRLRKNMEFTETAEQKEIFTEFTKNISSIANFIDDEYDNISCMDLSYSDMYSRYKEWAEKSGYKPQNKYNFLQSFKKLLAQQDITNFEKIEHGNSKKFHLPKRPEIQNEPANEIVTSSSAEIAAPEIQEHTPELNAPQINIDDIDIEKKVFDILGINKNDLIHNQKQQQQQTFLFEPEKPIEYKPGTLPQTFDEWEAYMKFNPNKNKGRNKSQS